MQNYREEGGRLSSEHEKSGAEVSAKQVYIRHKKKTFLSKRLVKP